MRAYSSLGWDEGMVRNDGFARWGSVLYLVWLGICEAGLGCAFKMPHHATTPASPLATITCCPYSHSSPIAPRLALYSPTRSSCSAPGCRTSSFFSRFKYHRMQLNHVHAHTVNGAVRKHVIGVNGVRALKVDGTPAILLRHYRLVRGKPLVVTRFVLVPSKVADDVDRCRDRS